MPCTPLGTLTTYNSLCKPAAGETGWAAAINGNWDIIDTELNDLVNTTPRSYLAGLSLINNGRTSIDVQIGFAIATDQSTQMSLTSVLTKNLASAWVVGSGNGGLFSGSATADTWYHVFLIKRTDTNVVDAGFDTSMVASNLPTNYTAYRRIGSVRTASSSSDIYKFTQTGDYFEWVICTQDSGVGNPGTGGNNRTLVVPTGVSCLAIINAVMVNTTTNSQVRLHSTINNSQATAPNISPLANATAMNAGSGSWGSYQLVQTDISAQILVRWDVSDANSVERLATVGWYDRRGRDN